MALPGWLETLGKHMRAGSAHTFLLTLNVGDYFPDDDGSFTTLTARLRSAFGDRRIFICYDRSRGISFLGATPEETRRMEREFRALLGIPVIVPVRDMPRTDAGNTSTDTPLLSGASATDAPTGAEPDSDDAEDAELEPFPRDPTIVLSLIERVLTMDPARVAAILGEDAQTFAGGWCVAFVGFVETIAPAGELSTKLPDVQTNIVTLARWSRDTTMAANGNIICMAAVNELDVTPYLRNAATSTVTIRIPFPNPDDRRAFLTMRLTALAATRPTTARETRVELIARATAGLTLRQLDTLVRAAALDERALGLDAVWERKKRIIEETSGGLLRVQRPVWTMDHIGGLVPVKRFLAEVAAAIRNGNVTQAPQGILFLGPPGCGKTIMAEALAHAVGFPMASLGDIQEKWLGQSGRNLSLVFEVLEELLPILVFEDEFDQRNIERGAVFHGDAGVGAELMAKKLEFLADSRHRGKILWIAASNRPDLIDPAMLRPGRFDTKVPFLPPEAEERAAIFVALMKKLLQQAQMAGQPLSWKVRVEDVVGFVNPLEGYTGAELEAIAVRATVRAGRAKRTDVHVEDIASAIDDYLPSRNDAFHRYATLLALRECDALELLPEKRRAEARDLRTRERLSELHALRHVLDGKEPDDIPQA